MKLLMITRRVDKGDAHAGFSYLWVLRLAEHVRELHVICLERGDTTGLPTNCFVHSLGKERGKNRWQLLYAFHRLARTLLPLVDGVFAHQNPEYGILIAPWAKLYRKPVIAWYTHGTVSWKTRLLAALVDRIITASSESFRLPSKKKVVLHHGIDLDHYPFQPKPVDSVMVLLSVSRLSRTKNIDRMVRLLAELKRRGERVQLHIAGGSALERDEIHARELTELVHELGVEREVILMGKVPHADIASIYHSADIFLNFSDTKSIDKAVLEAMSCGTLVLTTNEAFRTVMSAIHPDSYASGTDSATLADAVRRLRGAQGSGIVQRAARAYVEQNHSLNDLVEKILNLYES